MSPPSTANIASRTNGYVLTLTEISVHSMDGGVKLDRERGKVRASCQIPACPVRSQQVETQVHVARARLEDSHYAPCKPRLHMAGASSDVIGLANTRPLVHNQTNPSATTQGIPTWCARRQAGPPFECTLAAVDVRDDQEFPTPIR